MRIKLSKCIFFAFFILLMTASWSFSQEKNNKQVANDYIAIADEMYYEQNAPEFAKEQYVLAAEADPSNIKANFMAGKTYLETVNKDRATKYFLRVYELDPEYRFDIFYLIGRGYHFGLDFDRAIEYYSKYLEKLKSNSKYRGEDYIPPKVVGKRIQECGNGKEFVTHPANFSIVNMGSAINSPYPDYAPAVNRNETVMIFTSRRQEDNVNENVDSDNFHFEDIYISRKKDGEWTKAKNIGALVNTPFHDANISLSADGDQLYIYKDDNGGDIFVSKLLEDGETWSEPEPMDERINSSYSENSVSVSPDNKTIYFSSDRPGGFGGLDIYMSTMGTDNRWGKPINLGPEINTEFDEDGPFIDFDGKTLYFSSKGRNNMGGYDLYKSSYNETEKKWGPPKNLGYPINTPDDDIYFVTIDNGKKGYYASVRENSLGQTDIYMVSPPEDVDESLKIESKNTSSTSNTPDSTNQIAINQVNNTTSKKPVILIIQAFDQETNTPLGVKAILKNERTKRLMPFKIINTGKYTFNIKEEKAENFILAVEKEGYMYKNIKIAIPAASEKSDTVQKAIYLKKLNVGHTTVLRNIYFDFNKASLKSSSYDELGKLESLLSRNPTLKVEISGHTDDIGAASYNLQLSKQRASAVVNYLKQKGISGSRLISQGYGESRPLASNDDEIDGRNINRRVEFKVLEK